MGDSFAHLHVHTEYSMLDGAAKLKALFAEVTRLGMPAVAITDHGNLHGAPEFHREATAAGVIPIVGVELYKTPGTHRGDRGKVRWGGGGESDVGGGGAYTHMTALAENATGLRNLIELVSRSNLEGQVHAGFGPKPRVDEELLAQYAEGLIVTTGCLGGEVSTRLRLGQFDKACEAAGRLVDIFGRDQVFLEVMDHGIDVERALRPELLRLGRALNLRPLATNDSHYVTADQAGMHEAFLCVQSKASLANPKRFRFDGEGYHIKSPAEMRAYWDTQLPGACDNTLLVADRVQTYDEVFAPRQLMPVFPVPEGHTPETWLRAETMEGLRRRRAGALSERDLTQIEHELGVICQMGFPSYFLVVADFIGWAKSQGIAVGPGRGSAAGSLVAYALGITDLDPIPHGLIFERFLNPDRVSMPDVDIDFDPHRRGEVIAYVTRRWGKDFVSQIGTFAGIKAKAAIRDSAMVLDAPHGLGDRMARLMPKAIMGREADLAAIHDEDNPRYDEAGELRDLVAANADAARVFELARQVEGYKRGTGVHAAGVLISPVALAGVVPLLRRYNDGAVITQWDMNVCEGLGLLKMDFLGLRNLTVCADAVTNIALNRGEQVVLPTEGLDDPATYRLLARGDTLGVFQLDGGPMRALLRAMRPTCFEDISAVVALYRPGPMGANAHLAYAERKNGRAPVEPIHLELADALGPILSETYGVIVYQEQVMRIAQAVAGYTLAQADLLRRAMGKKKKEVLDKEFVPFSEGMKAQGYSPEAIKTLWDILVPFSDYAFNKAHSAAYGLISYWTAYLKANYPTEYMAALLTSVGDNPDRLPLYLAECRRMGIRVLVPDVNVSQASFTATGTDVRFGLTAVKGVGEGVVEAMLRCRAERGEAASFGDWLAKTDPQACKKDTVAALIKAGAFDSMGHSRRGLLDIHADALAAVVKGKKVEATGQGGLFDLVAEAPGAIGAVTAVVPEHEWPTRDRLNLEREVLRLYVSGHPLEGMERVLAAHGRDPIAELVAVKAAADEDAEPAPEVEVEPAYRWQEGQKVQVAGIIAAFERKVSRKSKQYVRMTVEDRDGASAPVLLFEKTILGLGDAIHLLREDVVVAVKGRLIGVNEGDPIIFGDDVMVLEATDAARAAAPRVTLTVTAEELTRELAGQLKELTEAYPGNSPLLVNLVSPRTASTTTLLTHARVNRANLRFVRDACALFGPNCLAA